VACWHTFVDESGSFGAPNEDTAIAGLLVQGGLHQGALRQAIQRALPGVPWPPHAAHLRTNSFRPAAVLLDPALERSAPKLVGDAAALLRHHPAPQAAALREEISRCQRARAPAHRLEIAVLRTTDAWLQREERGTHAALRAVGLTQEDAMWSLLSTLKRQATVVAAWDRSGSMEGDSARAYLDLFQALCERLHQLLGQGSGTTVVVVPATRHDVWSSQTQRKSDLLTGTPGPLHLLVGNAQSYNNPSPELVLADLVANRVRFIARKGGWSQVRQRWQCDIPLELVPLGLPGVALPVVAANGPARAAIRTATWRPLNDAELASNTASTPAWTGEQALAWSLALQEAL